MTLVLLGKCLVLRGWPSKIEVIWVLGKYTIHWASGYVTLVIFVKHSFDSPGDRKASIFRTRPRGVLISKLGWWKKRRFFIFTTIWGRFPFWLIFFNWVVQPPKTKSLLRMILYGKSIPWDGWKSPWNCFTKPLGFQTQNVKRHDWTPKNLASKHRTSGGMTGRLGDTIWGEYLVDGNFFGKHRREANLGGKIPRNAASFLFFGHEVIPLIDFGKGGCPSCQ